MEIIETRGFARALSDLQKCKNVLDSNSIVEISRNTGSASSPKYRSYRATLQLLNDCIIEKIDLYKNLNDIFDSAEYPNETFFAQDTTFNKNPFVQNIASWDSLNKNNLITKYATYEYLANNGCCVPVHRPNSNYVYYDSERKIWVNDNTLIPEVISPTKDGIWSSKSKLKFNFGTNAYAYTDEVKAKKNMLLNITGNILLYENYNEKWFENGNVAFVALTIDGHIITLTLLKNILKLLDENNNEYVVAQFHFNCPIAKDTSFRIITNADCKLFGISEEDQFSKTLYDSLNAVHLSYYDYGE